jgi:hypothetical protein
MISGQTRGDIQTRDHLIYALSLAAELEHGICLQYLYAAYTLKTTADGLTPTQAAMVNQWETDLLEIARQEMGHMGLVNNLLTAIGGSPHFHRPNFPQENRYGKTNIHLQLRPLTCKTLEAFIAFEQPQLWPLSAFAPTPVPTPFNYESIQELYRFIREGFVCLERKLRKEKKTLFIGPPEAQIDSERIGLRNKRRIYDVQLSRVTNLNEASKAIKQIVEEGEGSRKEHDDSHHKRLISIQSQYPKSNEFVPHRDVIDNPATREHRLRWSDQANLIEDPFTLKVAHLSNAAYEILLLTLIRFYAQIDATEAELATLQSTSFFPLMVMVVRPAAELLSTLPAGGCHGVKRAGPPFEFYGHVQLLPHRRSAWRVLYEKLSEMAEFCAELATEAKVSATSEEMEAAAPRLEFMRQNTWRIADNFKMAMGVS